eukprot:COSAG01_NODE_808_length_13418_cov_9.469631_9_plen_265_part_00
MRVPVPGTEVEGGGTPGLDAWITPGTISSVAPPGLGATGDPGAQVNQNGSLLSRRGRSSPANASGLDTHRDSISSRFDCRCPSRTRACRRCPSQLGMPQPQVRIDRDEDVYAMTGQRGVVTELDIRRACSCVMQLRLRRASRDSAGPGRQDSCGSSRGGGQRTADRWHDDQRAGSERILWLWRQRRGATSRGASEAALRPADRGQVWSRRAAAAHGRTSGGRPRTRAHGGCGVGRGASAIAAAAGSRSRPSHLSHIEVARTFRS